MFKTILRCQNYRILIFIINTSLRIVQIIPRSTLVHYTPTMDTRNIRYSFKRSAIFTFRPETARKGNNTTTTYTNLSANIGTQVTDTYNSLGHFWYRYIPMS